MMFTAEEQDLVTRVGPKTPMGQFMRRYWMPALLSEELPEPDGTPKALRILGEDLVAFRDTEGRVGVMDVHCPHRLASLALGRNEEGGLRCLYHGWKFDVAGKILETPCEPASSRLKENLVARTYPAREAHGAVWIYMGPKDKEPAFPDFRWMEAPADDRRATKFIEDCNWMQGMEGNIDSFHTNLLHSGYEVLHWSPEKIAEHWQRPSRAGRGSIAVEPTSYGFHYAAIREPDHESEKYDYVRVSEYVMPFFSSAPNDLGFTHGMTAYVPIDDYSTTVFGFGATEHRVTQTRHIVGRPQDKSKPNAQRILNWALDENYRPIHNRENNYDQDREAMRSRDKWHSFSGLAHVGLQDLAMIETMGPIADRSQEHLGSSDIAIRLWRDHLVGVVNSFLAGEEPPGVDPPAPYYEIASSGALIPKGGDWKQATWQAAAGQLTGQASS